MSTASGGGLLGDGSATALGLATSTDSLAKVSGNLLKTDGTSIGLGVTLPKSRLHVAGAVQLGNDPGGCTTDNAGAIRWTGTAFEGCNGFSWVSFNAMSRGDGSTAALAAASCRDLHTTNPTLGDGPYYIDADGGATTNAVRVYCLMTRGGGGWTKVVQYDNSTSLATTADVNPDGSWVSGPTGAGKLSAATMALL